MVARRRISMRLRGQKGGSRGETRGASTLRGRRHGEACEAARVGNGAVRTATLQHREGGVTRSAAMLGGRRGGEGCRAARAARAAALQHCDVAQGVLDSMRVGSLQLAIYWTDRSRPRHR